MGTDLRTELRLPSELLDAIRSLPATREVVHCQTRFQIPVFATYGACPMCGEQFKVRSFSGETEIEDVFDAVFEWMSSPKTSGEAHRRIAEVIDDLDDVPE